MSYCEHTELYMYIEWQKLYVIARAQSPIPVLHELASGGRLGPPHVLGIVAHRCPPPVLIGMQNGMLQLLLCRNNDR
jgi:hypothetical protein